MTSSRRTPAIAATSACRKPLPHPMARNACPDPHLVHGPDGGASDFPAAYAALHRADPGRILTAPAVRAGPRAGWRCPVGRTRNFAPAMAVLLAIGGSIAAAPIPALAECTGPDQWPRFRDGAASASVVVTGTVHDVAFDPRNPDRVAHFRLDVDRELRGTQHPACRSPAS